MAEHAEAALETAPPARTAGRRAGAGLRHERLDERAEVRARAASERMLNARPALAAQRAAAATLGRTRDAGPRPIQRQPACLPDRGPSGTGVVQAKLIRHGQEVKPGLFEWPSAVAKRYIAAPQTFVLRDDSAITAPFIHVIHADQKYLLGEQHGDGTWAARTAHWSVDTMHESRKAIPEEPAPGQGRGQSLESLHAFSMMAAISAQTVLHALDKIWTVVNAPRNALAVQASLPQLPGPLNQGKRWVVQLLTAGDKYRHFAVANVARNGEPAVALVRTFSADFEQTYRPELDAMLLALDALLGLGNQALELAAQAHYTTIYDGRASLTPLVARLLALMNTPATANVGRIQQLSQRAAANAPVPADSNVAASPHREAAMIANVSAAAAPLLVQLGGEHVDNIRAAVPDAVGVHVGTDFAALTRKED
jgi:hypothetical protein